MSSDQGELVIPEVRKSLTVIIRLQWKEHILKRQASEITSNTSAASPSPLTCAFSSQFHNDIQLSCADSHKSCLSLASRASAFESALTKVSLLYLVVNSSLINSCLSAGVMCIKNT